MVAFVIQENTPSGSSTEQVKVASSPGQTHSLLGETDLPAASEIKHLWRNLTKRSTYRHQHSLGYPDTCFSFADDIYYYYCHYNHNREVQYLAAIAPRGIQKKYPMLTFPSQTLFLSGYKTNNPCGVDQFHLNDAIVLSSDLVLLWFYRLGMRLAIRIYCKCTKQNRFSHFQVHMH